MIEHTYTVEGRGRFPFDMLRRDGSTYYTTRNKDTAEIENKLRRVTLSATNERALWEPLIARWESFGWKVVEVNGKARWQDFASSRPTADSPEYHQAFDAMLAALKTAEVVAEELCQGQDPANQCWVSLQEIKDAIAKAEGRS